MCKTKKVIILLLLAVVLVFSVAGCNTGTNELESKIDNLQSRLEELNGKLSEMERLQEELSEMNDKLTDMEGQIEQLEKELAEQSSGTLYTLQEAYDNGWLSQEDLMCIAYYSNGGRELNEEIMSEDYAPAPKTPEELSSLTELKIKYAAVKACEDKYDKTNVKSENFIITHYYGTYGDCIAVSTRNIYSYYPGVVFEESIGDVNFWHIGGREIKIWRETK